MVIAGKVAITPKGNWSSGTAYQKLDLVYYNNASYVAIQPSTGVTPTNTAYWMLVLQSAGEADFEEVMDAVNSIQSTSVALINDVGWYRVAEYSGSSDDVNGNLANSCKLSIRVQGTYGEFYEIWLSSINGSQTFNLLSAKTSTVQRTTKVRYTRDSTKAYLEVYKDTTYSANFFFIVNSPKDRLRCWQAITPTLTSETVDGVTVTTTYDIPANASPVTNLDLQRLDGTGAVLNTSILEKAKEVGVGVHVYRLGGSSYTGADLPSGAYYYCVAKIDKRANDEVAVTLSGIYSTNNKLTPPIFNMYNGTSWSGWQTIATTADLAAELAKYFPTNLRNKPQVITTDSWKSITISRTDNSVNSYANIVFANSSGILGGIGFDGNGNLIKISADGVETKTKQILHTGNMADHVLPLTGGTLTGNTYVKRTDGNSVLFGVENSSNRLHSGVNASGVAYMQDQNGNIIVCNADGTRTFNGTASGNLPLDGGGEVKNIDNTVINVRNTNGATAFIGYRGKEGQLGYMGFQTADNPVVYSATMGTKKLHHDGNSAKVHINPTSPSDNNSLWIDTSKQ